MNSDDTVTFEKIAVVRLPECGNMIYRDDQRNIRAVVVGEKYDITAGSFEYMATAACRDEENDNSWEYFYERALVGRT